MKMGFYVKIGVIRDYHKKGRVLIFEDADPNYPPQPEDEEEEKAEVMTTFITQEKVNSFHNDEKKITTDQNFANDLIEFINKSLGFDGAKLTRIVEFSLVESEKKYNLPVIPRPLSDNIPDYNSLIKALNTAIELLEDMSKRCEHLEVRLSALTKTRKMLSKIVVDKMSIEEVAAEFKITTASLYQHIRTFLLRFARQTKSGTEVARIAKYP